MIMNSPGSNSLKISTSTNPYSSNLPNLNSRQYNPSPLASSSSDPPSSPSSSSFYSTPKNPLRALTSKRTYQSTTSTRSLDLTSSLRLQTLSNLRKSRIPSLFHRGNDEEETNPFEIGQSGFESGSKNSEGQFELYTKEEEIYLNYQTVLEGKRRKKLWDEVADAHEDEVFDWDNLLEEGVGEEGEQEPPSDIYDNDSGESQQSIPSLPPENQFHLPSLASEPTTSNASSSQRRDMDVELHESQEESQGSNYSSRSSTYPTFAEVLLSSSCPACTSSHCVSSSTADVGGVTCTTCGWNITSDLLGPLESTFVAHSTEDHLPLFGWTQFTGTIILCSKCDAEFAV